MRTNQKFKAVILSLPVFVVILSGLLYLRSTLDILSGNTQYPLSKIISGSSEVKVLDYTKNSLNFSYILTSDTGIDTAGFSFDIKKNGKRRNLSLYNVLKIRISIKESTDVRLFLKEYIPGFTDIRKHVTFRHLEYSLKASREMKEYEIPLKDLQARDWWYKQNQLSREKWGRDTYKQIKSFEIHQGSIPFNVVDEIIVESIRFEQYNSWFFIASALFLATAYTAIILFFRKKQIPFFEQPTLAYKKLALTNYKDVNLKKILAKVSENFSDPEFSIHTICQDTGLNQKKVTALIKLHSNMTFSRYLNRLRLEEACKLIAETDNSVSDIAFSVGFSTFTHFSRLFKEFTGTSPKIYREQIRINKTSHS